MDTSGRVEQGLLVVVAGHRAAGDALAMTCAGQLTPTVTDVERVSSDAAALSTTDAVVILLTGMSDAEIRHVVRAVEDTDARILGVGHHRQAVTHDLAGRDWLDLDASPDEVAALVAEGRGTSRRSRPATARTAQHPAGLTAREHQVLRELLGGGGTEAIAQRLGISKHTVRTHLQNVLAKLGVGSRTEAAVWALREGLADAVPETGMRA